MSLFSAFLMVFSIGSEKFQKILSFLEKHMYIYNGWWYNMPKLFREDRL